MKYIELSQGKQAIVDDADFEWLNQWSWTYQAPGYAYRRADKKKIYMHRLIMNFPIGKDVDHINGTELDNRRSNLRTCEHYQNLVNSTARKKNKSGYKGVYQDSRLKTKPWYSEIKTRWGKKYLGNFATPEEAFVAFKQAHQEIYGEFSRMK